jgi:hypothetical protein
MNGLRGFTRFCSMLQIVAALLVTGQVAVAAAPM